MVPEKQVTIRLFFNKGDEMHYIQIGADSIYKIPEKVAARVQEKEGISITHVLSVQDMKIIGKGEEK